MTSPRTWMMRGAGAGLAALAGLFAFFVALDTALPPNMSRYEERSTIVLDANGDILRAFTTSDGMWRLGADADEVDPNFIAMLIAYEDQRFYRHPGVDPFALARAMGQWAIHGRPVSGASTLTMQTVRLLEPRPRTIGSKIIEMFRSLQLEWRYSKDEILNIYLTLAPYGGNLEGIRAASLAYFGREPAELTPSQSALLVALPQSPERLRPDRFGEAVADARAHVLARLEGAGVLTAQAVSEALEDPVPTARATLPFRAPHLAQRLNNGEPEVRTFIDGRLQDVLEDMVGVEAASLEDGASIAAMVVENETGRVVAYVGGADFWAPAGQIDLPRASRSPGSALKPFIYGIAFEDMLLHPETLIDDRALSFAGYAPQNFDRDHMGTITVRTALQQSLNVPAVAVLDRVGPVRLAARLEQAGAHLAFGQLAAEPSLPLALGGVGITLEDLTMLYVGVARGGEVTSLRYTDEDVPAETRRLLSDTASWYLTDILSGSPLPDGYGQGQGNVRVPVAFKTGTSYGYRDAWAVGFTPTHTVGIWVGRSDGAPRPGAYGRNTAAPVLFRVFDQLPPSTHLAPPPANAIIVEARGELPPGLRYFEPDPMDRFAMDRERVSPLQIAFPVPGTVMELYDGRDINVPLRANGGTPPLRWLIDGEVLPMGEDFASVLWSPDEPGFVDVTVVDSAGQSDSARVRLRRVN